MHSQHPSLLLGEYLLVHRLVGVVDLQRALQTQIWLAARHDTAVPLGEILTMHVAIDQAALELALAARDEAWQPLSTTRSAVSPAL